MRILFFIFLLVFFSCKEKTEKNQNQLTDSVEEKVIKPLKELIFEIDLETTRPDEFTLFSRDIFLNNNQFMDIKVRQKLNSNETSKKLVFKLPEGVTPDYNLGLILGNQEKEVIIKNISISFADNVLQVNPEELLNYFDFNRFIKIENNGKLIITEIDGKINPTMLLRKKQLVKLIP